ncbi:TIGR04255 family protein [Nocardia yamanashiensis]|uniref:TIGR04255 family protein n=1 Tax=Nocardia yamanashiensis TaxID=209247 RepID=UPI0009FFF15F|nr:TIGR04255 family protein [Nocardia yamanashiensis]
MATHAHPFAAQEPGNIPLSSAPLVRTIAQVRFPHLTRFTINEDEVAHGVAAALAEQYPVMEVGRDVSVVITPEGVSETANATRIWRVSSSDRVWQISFTGTFLSIDTTSYDNRSDFAQRLNEAWLALNRQIEVPYIDRLGIRYVNQVTDRDHLKRLPELLRPEVLGIATTQEPGVAMLSAALSEVQYAFPDGGAFLARWGLLAAGARVDVARPAYDYPTWLLDMDSFREYAPGSQSGGTLFEDIRALALRGYQFFRWAVTDEFLTAFGGAK